MLNALKRRRTNRQLFLKLSKPSDWSIWYTRDDWFVTWHNFHQQTEKTLKNPVWINSLSCCYCHSCMFVTLSMLYLIFWSFFLQTENSDLEQLGYGLIQTGLVLLCKANSPHIIMWQVHVGIARVMWMTEIVQPAHVSFRSQERTRGGKVNVEVVAMLSEDRHRKPMVPRYREDNTRMAAV